MNLLKLMRIIKPLSEKITNVRELSSYNVDISDNERTSILIDKNTFDLEIMALSKNTLIFNKLIKAGYNITKEDDDFYFDICTEIGAKIKKPMFTAILSCL